MNIHAFIVGIDTYSEAAYNVNGPCANAIAVARWLREIGTPGGNITLFLDPSEPPEMEDLVAAGIDHRRFATRDRIDSFWRKELAAGCSPGSRLLVFWSGHGATAIARQHVLFCHDYDEETKNRLFNITSFLEYLKTAAFQCFRDQIILVDSCSVYLDRQIPDEHVPDRRAGTHQLAYFARPEGQYAAGKDGRGVFTDVALSVLRRIGGWPDHESFVKQLNEDLKAIQAPGFWVSYSADGGAREEVFIGARAPSAQLRDLPALPDPYVAHPYTFLHRGYDLIGRTDERAALTEWLQADTPGRENRVFVLWAMGGMGKSALTWTWFNSIDRHGCGLAGCIWWSFYAPDATFESFVRHALAYTRGQNLSEVQLPLVDCQLLLQQELQRRRFLIVLDGLERLLAAFHRFDAANIPDGDVASAEFADAEFPGVTQRRISAAVDPRVAMFLQSFLTEGKARLLISSRLYPADLGSANRPAPGCCAHRLGGLTPDDAYELWSLLGASGSQPTVKRYLAEFDNLPLFIKILAGEVCDSFRARGNFDAWLTANPGFNPGQLEIRQRSTHVLYYAMRGLPADRRRALEVIVAFRMPVAFADLAVTLVDVAPDRQAGRNFADRRSLERALIALQDRNLLNFGASNFELHPVIRAYLWGCLDADAKTRLLELVADYAGAQASSGVDIRWATEQFYALVGLRRWLHAYEVFKTYLDDNLYYILARGRDRAELLRHLLTDCPDEYRSASPEGVNIWLQDAPVYHTLILHSFAKGANFLGDPSNAAASFDQAAGLLQAVDETAFTPIENFNFVTRRIDLPEVKTLRMVIESEKAHSERLSGQLQKAERSARLALSLSDDAFCQGVNLYRLGLVLAVRGRVREAKQVYEKSLKIWEVRDEHHLHGFLYACLARLSLWQGRVDMAAKQAKQAWNWFEKQRYELNTIHGLRLLGMVALAEGDFPAADEHLTHALERARRGERVEETLLASVPLADLYRQRGDTARARDILSDMERYSAKRCYPCFFADGYLVLALLEREAGDAAAALVAADEALVLSACDGGEFRYHWGYLAAKRLRMAMV